MSGGQSRQKRVRTSFKHHQLRAMKSYFALNHNPDAKDLKQLAQKTGLSKRVLQVSVTTVVDECTSPYMYTQTDSEIVWILSYLVPELYRNI